ncbi:UDP-glycosyltransferase 71A15 [Linum grandiflorum]
MTQTQLAFVPAPAIGHLVSTIEFARRLLRRQPNLSVLALIIKLPPPFGDDIDRYIQSITSTNDDDDTRIRFLTLPQQTPPPPPPSSAPDVPPSPEAFISSVIEAHKPLAKEAILLNSSHSSSALPPVSGLVIDLFCTSMIDVANELGIPSFLFFTSSIAFLGFMLYLPIRHDRLGTGFELYDPTETVVPSYADPIPSRFLPSFLLDNRGGGYSAMMNHGRRFWETKGIIVNSFAELEPHAVNSLTSSSSLLLRGGALPPPVYPVGPLLDLKGQGQVRFGKIGQRDEVMKWLDDQPEESVVFLCFGSMGTFGERQLKEIATGLERSGYRFLWSIRKPPSKETLSLPANYESYGEILPQGFEERTAGTGMICGWAPQGEVLGHKAVGGFVSHCGWNSTLESVWNGVPMVAWPLYAEQQSNAVELVRELGVAVELRFDYRLNSDDEDHHIIVAGEEIEKAVRSVMEKESAVRKKVKEMAENSRAALVDGGSSFAAIGSFLSALSI